MLSLLHPLPYYELILLTILGVISIFWTFARILGALLLTTVLWTTNREYLPSNLMLIAAYILCLSLSYSIPELFLMIVPIPLSTTGIWLRSFSIPVFAAVYGLQEAKAHYMQLSAHTRAFPEYTSNLSSQAELPLFQLLGSMISPFLGVRVALEILFIIGVCSFYGAITFLNAPERGGENLREATRNNDIESVETCLQMGADPDCQDQYGMTCLHICAQQALIDISDLLLRYKAIPNLQDSVGFTPLHWAVQMRKEEPSELKRLELVRLLISHGASTEIEDMHGNTPVVIASRKGNESALEVLGN